MHPRRWTFAAATAALLLSAAPVMAAAPAVAERTPGGDLKAIEVRVLPYSEVQGNTFTLGEVSELDGFDLDAVRALSKVSLGPSPRPGQSLVLSEPLLRSRLVRSTGLEDVHLAVPEGAQVVRASQTIAGRDIGAKVLAVAAQDAEVARNNLKQDLLSPLPDVVLPKGEVTWEVQPLGRYLATGGARTFTVTAQVNGREAWRGIARVAQSVYQTVVVARRPIHRDQIIQQAEVALERKDVSRVKEEAFLTSLEQVVGKRASRPIGEDEWLHAGMVSAPMDIAAGGRVRMIFQTPLLLVQTPGVALAPGKVGDFIPVRNLQSGKIVYGIVQSEDTIKVN
jgi:flagella basal body P-ring formation protein FlgA